MVPLLAPHRRQNEAQEDQAQAHQEWKADAKYGSLNPNTIRLIKDRLLRVRLTMAESDS